MPINTFIRLADDSFSQSGQALLPPLKLRQKGLAPAAPARRACATSSPLSSARQTFPSGLWPTVKDCFVLHGHFAFGSVAKYKSGVGRKSATSGGLTTDPSHWLQAGKTVDISRCASESTDLLPPSALPRSLPLPAAMPTRPAMPAAVTSSPSPWPPSPWLADYRCQSADAELPPVRLPNPCRLRRHPLSGELPASRPVAPVIVLPLLMLM